MFDRGFGRYLVTSGQLAGQGCPRASQKRFCRWSNAVRLRIAGRTMPRFAAVTLVFVLLLATAVTIIFALLAGNALFGVVGMFLARLWPPS